MKDKTSWFIRIWDEKNPSIFGLGECGPLPGLSIDAKPDFEETLSNVIEKINEGKFSEASDQGLLSIVPGHYPAILLGMETALLDLQHGGQRVIFQNDFLRGKRISINGLIWMGDMDFLMGQISIKVSEGFKCIKLKVGGLDFDRECDVLHYIRKRYFREDITIRLDANGAFKVADAMYKLEQLARFGIHSIEQPIKPGLAEMESLCRQSPIPVAFDEELIGLNGKDEKLELLKRLRPKYIVLKPMLHGGFRGCQEWIRLAEGLDIGWWITSSLESSIGLNAICQFTANYSNELHQGLGTGKIYDDNFESPLEVLNGEIFYNHKLSWDQQISDADFTSPEPQTSQE